MEFSMAEEIRQLLKRKGITIKELSRRLGKSNQNMANKLKRDNFSMNELIEIAKVTDCTFQVAFIDKTPKSS